MKPTQTLEREHRIIGHVANACGVLAEMFENGSRVPASVLRQLVGFLQAYGGQYHQEEEEWLVSMLMSKGIPQGSCPIAVLTHEDQKLTVLTYQLAKAVEVYEKNSGHVTGAVVSTLRALAELYPDHIWKEDYLLLPMAEKLLSEEDQLVLADALGMIDSAKGTAARKSLHQLNEAMKSCPECNPPVEQPAA